MSDRTPSTDALGTLGMIHFKPEHRDAIHLAVEPVVAAMPLQVGQKIGIVLGKAYPAGYVIQNEGQYFKVIVKFHGIVDPFLPRDVQEGESFWFVMAPRMVTSLRHVWEHPDFAEGV